MQTAQHNFRSPVTTLDYLLVLVLCGMLRLRNLCNDKFVATSERRKGGENPSLTMTSNWNGNRNAMVEYASYHIPLFVVLKIGKRSQSSLIVAKEYDYGWTFNWLSIDLRWFFASVSVAHSLQLVDTQPSVIESVDNIHRQRHRQCISSTLTHSHLVEHKKKLHSFSRWSKINVLKSSPSSTVVRFKNCSSLNLVCNTVIFITLSIFAFNVGFTMKIGSNNAENLLLNASWHERMEMDDERGKGRSDRVQN